MYINAYSSLLLTKYEHHLHNLLFIIIDFMNLCPKCRDLSLPTQHLEEDKVEELYCEFCAKANKKAFAQTLWKGSIPPAI